MLTARFISMPLEASIITHYFAYSYCGTGSDWSFSAQMVDTHTICKDKINFNFVQRMNTKEVQLQELQWRIF